jgi:hypothetical protein
MYNRGKGLLQLARSSATGVLAAATLSWSCWPYTSALKCATSTDSISGDDSSSRVCCGSLDSSGCPSADVTSLAANIRAPLCRAATPRSTRAGGGVLLLGVCSCPACLQTYCRLLSASLAAGRRAGAIDDEPRAPSDPGQKSTRQQHTSNRVCCGEWAPGFVKPRSLQESRPRLQKWHGAPHHPNGFSCCSCCRAVVSAAGSCCSSPDAAIWVLMARVRLVVLRPAASLLCCTLLAACTRKGRWFSSSTAMWYVKGLGSKAATALHMCSGTCMQGSRQHE